MNRMLTLAVTALLATAALGTGVALAAGSPTVSSVSASSIGNSSAVLEGTVNPNGAAASYFFEYGLTSAYGVTSKAHSAGKGTKPVAVKTTASGLLPGTTYHFRLVALNKSGVTIGSDHTFKTTGPAPAVVATGPATTLTSQGATLTGVITPHGAATNYYFQYGLTVFYLNGRTPGGTVPAGSAPVNVAEVLGGLSPGTTFHYRLVAVHAGGVTSYGSDQAFMTLPNPRPVPRVTANTLPGRAKKSPYRFSTFGHVNGPAATRALACTGNVSIRYFNGRHKVSSRLAPLQPNCTFSAQASFRHLPGHGSSHRIVKLKILIHFQGNGYLAPKDARTEFVKLGKG
ncbi:MAG: fibronectin type III domain-containing protein [Actinomycetota bacterium]|nr:fibronectin type III domain-containing protein [Actinomycetota bacterium]